MGMAQCANSAASPESSTESWGATGDLIEEPPQTPFTRTSRAVTLLPIRRERAPLIEISCDDHSSATARVRRSSAGQFADGARAST